MKVLDLFAGLGGWSAAARDRGHEVLTLDLDPRFGCDITADLLEVDIGELGHPDLLLASPPCTAFSLMAVGHHWHPGRVPATEGARLGIRLVERTLEIVDELQPAFWYLENPLAMLRKLECVGGRERRTVTYCQLGEPFRKATDIFGGFGPSLELPPPCRNGDPCHVAAPRGSRTGIQGDSRPTAAERAVIPYQLSELVVKAAELDLASGRRHEPEPRLFV